jgi:hypothetical protein
VPAATPFCIENDGLHRFAEGWRRHLIGGALIAFGDVEHVPAPIFMRLGRGRFGKPVRPAAIHARAAVCGSRFGGHYSLAVRLL